MLIIIIITTKLIKQLILIEGYLYAGHRAIKTSLFHPQNKLKRQV